MTDSEPDEEEFSSSQENLSDDSSCGYDGAEWLEHVRADGSLLYIESYVSSTVREKQVLALRNSRENQATSHKKQDDSDSKMGKLKKENKLLGLLRRRPSIRSKASKKLSLSVAVSSGARGDEGGGGTSKREGGASTTDSNSKPRDTSPAPKVTFRDNKSGEMRTVALHVVSVGDGRGGLCEAVLGVVAGRFSEPPLGRIMVAGILPGSEAHTTHAIKIGDWLKEIDRREVSWDNIDAVLGEIRVPSVVTLGLQKCASETLTDQDRSNTKHITQTQLVKYIIGNHVQEKGGGTAAPSNGPSHQPYDLVKGSPPHVALALTLTGVTDTSPEGSDIRYQFPRGSSRLVRVRGVFLTLAHTLHDLTQQQATSSTVQLNSEEIVHVVYHREEDLVWIMAVPHTYCSEHELLNLCHHVTKNLFFEFGSLTKAVYEPSEQQQQYLDHLMGKVFSGVLQTPQHRQHLHHSFSLPTVLPTSHYMHPNNYLPHHAHSRPLHDTTAALSYKNLEFSGDSNASSGSGLYAMLGSPPWLLLQDGGGGAKMEVDNCLSELEAGDFGEDDESDCEECDDSMLHNVEGCCLFYKGVVVCSHLPPLMLRLAYTHARLHGLLALTSVEAVSQMVAWRKVYYISSNQDDNDENSSSACLLMVAMNHMLIAMVLEDNTHTRRCSSWCQGPDPFLVDQVEATLFHLHSLHIPALCQDSLSHGGPEVVSAEDRYNAMVPDNKKQNKRTSEADTATKGSIPPLSHIPDVPSILKQRPPACDETGDDPLQNTSEGYTDAANYASNATLVGEEDEDEETEEDDNNQAEGSQWRFWRGALSSPSLRDSDADPTPLNRLPVTTIRLTTGPSPALFHIVHLDVGEGVMIESLPSTDATQASPLHQAVLANFRLACLHIHKVLHSTLFYQMSDTSPDSVKEHGVLFSCANAAASKKRPAADFNYWVVGRLVPSCQKEVYVCYHENVPQNLHEMAAKLCLGATL